MAGTRQAMATLPTRLGPVKQRPHCLLLRAAAQHVGHQLTREVLLLEALAELLHQLGCDLGL